MKRGLLLIVIATGAIFISIAFSSCKKKETPLPDYPQLLGTWPGTTSQGTTISLGVTNINGTLYINQYDLTVYTASGYQALHAGNSDGLAVINNTQFNIHIGTGSAGESYIDGTFDVQDTTLSGNFAVYPSGNTIDLISGYYYCNKRH
jgi:hypothetical protein